MNKILFAVSKAKRLTEKEAAEAIEITEKEYNELEYNLRKISLDM